MKNLLRIGLYISLMAGLVVGFTACEKDGEEQQAATGQNDQGGTGGKTEPQDLKLAKAHVEAIAGTPLEVAITEGSGSYKEPLVDPAEILTAVVKDGKLMLTVKKAGKATVTLTDSKLNKTAQLTAQTYMLAFQWVDIPAGTFMMGSTKMDSESSKDERPQHEVKLSAFRMATTEVTFEQYDAYCKEKKITPPGDAGWGRSKRPVIYVSWHDAKAFCEWAGVLLPTEAQWEYACRAGNEGKYCFGNETAKLGEYAWFVDNSGKQSHPVMGKKPNAYGLYDMHGNVWEWCEDKCTDDNFETYYQSCKDKGVVTDPRGPETGDHHMLRGGGWLGIAKSSRSAYRYQDVATLKDRDIGFRVVAPPTPTPKP